MGLKEIQEDVDEMSKALDDQPFKDATDSPPTDPPPTKAPSTESVNTDPPETDSPETESPETDAPSTDAPEDNEKDRTIKELMDRIAKLEAKPTDPPPTQTPSTDAPISEEDFIGDMNLSELSEDPKLFKQILNSVYKKAIESVRSEVKKGDETIIRSIPEIVKNNINILSELEKVNESFYDKNKDLIPFKKVVATIYEEELAKDPSRSYKELLPDVAKETRRRLDLHKKANQDNKPPPLERRKRGKRQQQKPDISELQNDLDEMDRVLGI